MTLSATLPRFTSANSLSTRTIDPSAEGALTRSDAAGSDARIYSTKQARTTVGVSGALECTGFILAQKCLPVPKILPALGVYVAGVAADLALLWAAAPTRGTAPQGPRPSEWRTEYIALGRCVGGIGAGLLTASAHPYTNATRACALGAGLPLGAYTVGSYLAEIAAGKGKLLQFLAAAKPFDQAVAIISYAILVGYPDDSPWITVGSAGLAIHAVVLGLQAGAKDGDVNPHITTNRLNEATMWASIAFAWSFMVPPMPRATF